MKIIDAHVDIADICTAFEISIDDFIAGKATAPVDLPKLINSNIKLIEVTTQQAIEQLKEDQIGLFYSIEGLEALRTHDDFFEFYDMGVKIWGLTWSNNNAYASSAQAESDKGLTQLGKSLVKEMEKKNVIIDAAHLSDQSFKDLTSSFDGLIINTHSNSRTVRESTHNMTDYQIDAIAERGGVICLFLLAEDVGIKGTFEELFKHFEYIESKWGFDCISFSSDIFPLNEYPFVNNAKDITIMKDLQDFLLTRLTESEVKKVMHDNFLRVLTSAF